MTKLNDYGKLYEYLGYHFENETLLDEAFTHKGLNHSRNYERLEFLGDRVVNLVIAEMLLKEFPNESEGAINRRHTALVRMEALSQVVLRFHMEGYIKLAKCDEGERKNPSILCDVCEAVCGALYLDGGYDKVRDFIWKNWAPMVSEYKTPPVDAKTKLQEWVQAKRLPPPVYEVLSREGAEHSPIFTVRAEILGKEPQTAKGSSKREAEQRAAALILQNVGVKL